GLWSVGIGGHINPSDADDHVAGGPYWRQAIWNGRQRELAEEFPSALNGKSRFLGLIHESRSAVGRVHLGAVFVHDLLSRPNETGIELTGMQWIANGDIGNAAWPLHKFELWSQLSLLLLGATSQ